MAKLFNLTGCVPHCDSTHDTQAVYIQTKTPDKHIKGDITFTMLTMEMIVNYHCNITKQKTKMI